MSKSRHDYVREIAWPLSFITQQASYTCTRIY